MFRPAAAALVRGWFGCGDNVVERGQSVAPAESRNFACNTPVHLALPRLWERLAYRSVESLFESA